MLTDKAGQYRQNHWWWDEYDNEYMLEAVWNYTPDDDDRYMGESELIELECVSKNANDIDHLLNEGGDIWRYVEKDFDIIKADRIDDYDIPDYYGVEY